MGLGDWNIIHKPQNLIISAGGSLDHADEPIKVSLTRLPNYSTPSEHRVWHSMPALTRESFLAVHMGKLTSNPRTYWWDINVLFAAIPELVDPVTRERFEFCEIPWSCITLEPAPEKVERIKKIDAALVLATREWAESREVR